MIMNIGINLLIEDSRKEDEADYSLSSLLLRLKKA